MKKISLASIPFLALTFLVSCNNATEYKVSIPDTKEVSIYPGQAYKGKDYVGTIEILSEFTSAKLLPDKLDKVTSGNKALQPTEYTYTLKEDKLTADFKIPAANIVGDVAIQLTLVDKPGPTPVDPYQVTEDEFNDACSFKSVQYVQSYLEGQTSDGTFSSQYELSPTVSHMINETEIPTPFYIDQFVKKNGDGSYEKAHSNTEGGTYTFESAYVTEFVTPQSESFNVSMQLKIYGLSYSSFDYNANEGIYSATFNPVGGSQTTMTLKFQDKQLIKNDNVAVDGSAQSSSTYTYLEKTPTYPEKPADTTVTKDEFTTALAFEGVEYLQEENNSVYSESTKQISPSTYYERSTVISFLTEQYVYKLKEDIYKKIMRNDSTTDWKNINWESATEQELCTPQMVGKSISDILSTYNVEEFDPEKYDSTTQSYVLSGDSYNFSFKFENKKLVQFGDADGQMTYTYTYEEKTPELPIDPPKPPEPGQEYTLTFYESDGQTVYTTVTITSDNPTFVVPNHDEDEGTWEFKVGVIQGLTPGLQVTIPAEDLDDYDLVWTPQTNSVPLSI